MYKNLKVRIYIVKALQLFVGLILCPTQMCIECDKWSTIQRRADWQLITDDLEELIAAILGWSEKMKEADSFETSLTD
jgi:hypothetical protein